MKQTPKSIRFFACLLLAVLLSIGCFAGCAGNSEKQVVIYSNADDEAVESMKKTLDENGFAGKYIFQSFGTSELGGKLLAEGKDIEADVITMSSYYLDSAQQQHNMFQTLSFTPRTLDAFQTFMRPLSATRALCSSTPRC